MRRPAQTSAGRGRRSNQVSQPMPEMHCVRNKNCAIALTKQLDCVEESLPCKSQWICARCAHHPAAVCRLPFCVPSLLCCVHFCAVSLLMCLIPLLSSVFYHFISLQFSVFCLFSCVLFFVPCPSTTFPFCVPCPFTSFSCLFFHLCLVTSLQAAVIFCQFSSVFRVRFFQLFCVFTFLSSFLCCFYFSSVFTSLL